MASGETVSGGGMRSFNDMKVFKPSGPEEVRCKKTVSFCPREDKKNTILQEGNHLAGDMERPVEGHHLCQDAAVKGFCSLLCDARRGKIGELGFIFWAPEGAPSRAKSAMPAPQGPSGRRQQGSSMGHKQTAPRRSRAAASWRNPSLGAQGSSRKR